MPIDDPREGEKVWEHWCTLRDLRPTNQWALSALSAYIALVSWAGDLFVAIVARGRKSYGHPEQLAALAKAGFVSKEAIAANLSPHPIPSELEPILNKSSPGLSLDAAGRLDWTHKKPIYYMFGRRIAEFATPEIFKILK